MERLYTLEEVCLYLKVDRSTLYHWRKQGKIKTISVGGSVRIKESDLKKFLESGKGE